MRGVRSRWLAFTLVLLLPMAGADGEEEEPQADEAPPAAADASIEDGTATADAGAADAGVAADSGTVSADASVDAPATPEGVESPPTEVHQDVAVPEGQTAPEQEETPAQPPAPAEHDQEDAPAQEEEPREEDVGEAEPERPSPIPSPRDLLGLIPEIGATPALDLTFRLPRDADAPQPAANQEEAAPQELALQNDAVAYAGPDLTSAPALLAIGATAAVGALLVPGTRHALLGLLRALGIASLFTRVRDHQVLEHPRRRDIVEYVRNHPGERLEIVRRDLGLSNGTMLHHLKILDHHDQVRVHREGTMARLYPAGPRIQPTPYLLPQRKQLLDQLRAQPGITQRELAATAGLSERAVSYHVGWLTAQGLLQVEREGTSKRCFLASAAPAMPAA